MHRLMPWSTCVLLATGCTLTPRAAFIPTQPITRENVSRLRLALDYQAEFVPMLPFDGVGSLREVVTDGSRHILYTHLRRFDLRSGAELPALQFPVDPDNPDVVGWPASKISFDFTEQKAFVGVCYGPRYESRDNCVTVQLDLQRENPQIVVRGWQPSTNALTPDGRLLLQFDASDERSFAFLDRSSLKLDGPYVLPGELLKDSRVMGALKDRILLQVLEGNRTFRHKLVILRADPTTGTLQVENWAWSSDCEVAIEQLPNCTRASVISADPDVRQRMQPFTSTSTQFCKTWPEEYELSCLLPGGQLRWLVGYEDTAKRFALADNATCEVLCTRNCSIPRSSDLHEGFDPVADPYGRYVGAYGGYRLLLYAVPDEERNQ